MIFRKHQVCGCQAAVASKAELKTGRAHLEGKLTGGRKRQKTTYFPNFLNSELIKARGTFIELWAEKVETQVSSLSSS